MANLRAFLILFISSALVAWVYLVHRLADQPLGGAGAGSTAKTEIPGGEPGDIEKFAFSFASNAECEPCHREIYKEWFEDQHALAWFNAPFLAQDPKLVECNNCHAPLPILEVGLDRMPIIRTERFAEGVGCIECHKNGDHVEGPLPGAEAACNPRFNSTFGSSQICRSCHEAHGTFEEWKSSSWAKKGYTCQACHLPLVDAPAVTGGPPVRRRSHRMISQRNPEFLRRAVTLEAGLIDGNKVNVTLTNSGSGHNVPGEISNREVFLKTVIRDRQGRPREEHRESFKTVLRQQRSSLPTTQLTPGEARTFTYDLGAGPGKIHILLGYKFFYFLPDEQSIPMGEKELEF